MNIIMLLPVRVPSFFVHQSPWCQHFHRPDTIEFNAIFTSINEIAPKTVSSINRRLRYTIHNTLQSIIHYNIALHVSLLYLARVGSITIDDLCFMTKRAFIIRYFWRKLQYPTTLMPTSHYRDVAVIILFFEHFTLNVYDRRLKSKDSPPIICSRVQIITHHVYNVRTILFGHFDRQLGHDFSRGYYFIYALKFSLSKWLSAYLN